MWIPFLHVYLDTVHYTTHRGLNTSKTVAHKNTNDKKKMTAYLHEVALGVKHAGAYGLVPVVEADHVEADSLRYSQEECQHPNRHDLNDCQQRDAHSLNSAPGCHSPVPVKDRHSLRVQAYHINMLNWLLGLGAALWYSTSKIHILKKILYKINKCNTIIIIWKKKYIY